MASAINVAAGRREVSPQPLAPIRCCRHRDKGSCDGGDRGVIDGILEYDDCATLGSTYDAVDANREASRWRCDG